MSMLKRLTQSAAGVAVLVAAVVSVNVIASRLYLRGDVTEDNVFSLSEGSRNIAADLPEEVTAKLYFSRSAKDLPVQFKNYGTRIAEMLQEYAAASGGKLRVEVIDPKPDTDEEEWARKYGVEGVNAGSGDDVYLGVVFIAGETEAVIPFLDPRKEEFVEADLSEALYKLKDRPLPKLGVMASLPVMGGAPSPMMMQQQPPEEWVVVQGLRNTFEVVEVGTDVDAIEADIGVLLVVHPKALSDKAQWAIDQFVMRGGRLIAAVDPFSRVDLAANPPDMSQGRMAQVSSSLDRLFGAYGVVYDANVLVGDPLRATRINAGGELLNYPFFLSLQREDIDEQARITASLRQLLLGEAGALDVKPDSGVTMTPLLSTSADSGTREAMIMQFVSPGDAARQLATDGKKRVLAALYAGKFNSAFPDGPPEGVTAAAPLKEAAGEGTILVVADVDFMHDGNSVDKMRLGQQIIARPRNGNLSFVLNAADFLGGSPDLISIRSSGKVARPFTRVLELEKAAQARWKAEEDALSSELEELERNLNELQAARSDADQMTLTAEQQSEIQRFRDREVEIRKRRREVRKNLREEIEALGHRLVAINLLAVPALVGLFGFVVLRRRAQRKREDAGGGAGGGGIATGSAGGDAARLA